MFDSTRHLEFSEFHVKSCFSDLLEFHQISRNLYLTTFPLTLLKHGINFKLYHTSSLKSIKSYCTYWNKASVMLFSYNIKSRKIESDTFNVYKPVIISQLIHLTHHLILMNLNFSFLAPCFEKSRELLSAPAFTTFIFSCWKRTWKRIQRFLGTFSVRPLVFHRTPKRNSNWCEGITT